MSASDDFLEFSEKAKKSERKHGRNPDAIFPKLLHWWQSLWRRIFGS